MKLGQLQKLNTMFISNYPISQSKIKKGLRLFSVQCLIQDRDKHFWNKKYSKIFTEQSIL